MITPCFKSLPGRFWSKVRYSPGCWEWTAGTSRKGYGKLNVGGSYKYSHRLALAWALGRSLDSSELVLHDCHNPGCVNPDHLRLGTHPDNMVDMTNAGRSGKKYTQAQAANTRRVLVDMKGVMTYKGIAGITGVSVSVVQDIALGRTWLSLGGAVPVRPRRGRPSN